MTADTGDPLPQFDTLLHEPARLKLLPLLSVVKRADFTSLLKRLGLSRGNLSVRMGPLDAASLVDIEKTYRGNHPRTIYKT